MGRNRNSRASNKAKKSSNKVKQPVKNAPGPVRNSTLDEWLQSNIDDYASKSRVTLDSILNSKNSDDVAKKFAELTCFVHDSLAKVRKLIDTRRVETDFEEKLALVECSEMRRDKQIRYLTSPCERWWLDPNHNYREPPNTYYTLTDWKGVKDERTACQFVEEFIEKVLPYSRCTRAAMHDFFYRLDLSENSSSSEDLRKWIENNERKGICFVDYIESFICSFTPDSLHYKQIADFEAAHPDDQAVFSFVQSWLGKFRFNPKVHPAWVIHKLIDKVPRRYVSPLQRLKYKNCGVSYSTISKAVYDQAKALKESVPDAPDYLGYRFRSERLEEIKKTYSVEYVTDEVLDDSSTDGDLSDSDDEDLIIVGPRGIPLLTTKKTVASGHVQFIDSL